MIVNCEYCGRYFDVGDGWRSYFRDKPKAIGHFSVYTLSFCCMGHLDAFRAQTKMIEVNKDGYTQEELRIKQFAEKLREHNKNIDYCEQCGNSYTSSQGFKCEGHRFCSKDCLNAFFLELRKSQENLIGKWRGGDPYELEFRKMGCGFNGFFALCTKESPSNTSSNSFKEGQMLFRDVEFTNTSNISGQILVPIQSGDQKWFSFTGTIKNDEMSVEIGNAKWGWGYKKILLEIKDRDELFEEAARLVVEFQQGSTSLIQRKLKIDYDQACKILEQLELACIVSPFEGSKVREVKFTDLVLLEDYLKKIGNA